MPLGIVSDSDFDSEFSKLKNPQPKVTVPSTQSIVVPTNQTVVDIIEPTSGRGKGNVEVPDSLRRIIGETSKIEGRAAGVELAKQFDISSSSVSAYANGSTSTKSYDKQPNLNHINQAKERISKRARIKLNKALFHITDEKLEGAKATDLSSVAKDMAAIIKVMEPEKPKEEDPGKTGPNFIFYAPQYITEEVFETIHAKD